MLYKGSVEPVMLFFDRGKRKSQAKRKLAF